MATTLVLTNDFPPRIGGIESFVAEACELLDGDVLVYASGPPGAAATDADRGYPVVRGGRLLLPTPATTRQAVRLLSEAGASRVLLGAAAPLGLLAPALRRAGAQRVVGLTHGHEVWWAQVPGARRVLRRIGDDCDHLTTISDFTTAAIAPALSGPARTRLLRLPPPVDLSRFAPTLAGPTPTAPHPAGGAERAAPGLPTLVPPAGAAPRCIAVGRFVAQKGFDTLIRAWARVQDDWPTGGQRPELVLVGDGPRRSQLRGLVHELGLGARVRFTGPLGRAEVVHELRAAQVFALPVRTRLGGLNAEGLGLAAVEAAACGLPVVVGRSGGAPETVRDGDTGYVVPPDDPETLARVIAGLLLDPVRAAAMGRAGRQHVAERYGREQARIILRRALGLPA